MNDVDGMFNRNPGRNHSEKREESHSQEIHDDDQIDPDFEGLTVD